MTKLIDDKETAKKIASAMQEIGLELFHCSYEGKHVVDVIEVRYLPNSMAENDGAFLKKFKENLEQWLLTTNTNDQDKSSDDRLKGEIYLNPWVFEISEA